MTEKSFATKTGQLITVETKLTDNEKSGSIVISIKNGEYFAIACFNQEDWERLNQIIQGQALGILADILLRDAGHD